MPEFKNKEEYEQWKSRKLELTQKEKLRDDKGASLPPQSIHTKSEFKIDKKFAFFVIGLVIVLTGLITFLLTGSRTSTTREGEKSMQSLPSISIGKIFGNIFVSMKSGDIKKAGGITVTLLKNQDTIMKGVDQIAREVKEPLLEVSEAMSKVQELQAKSSAYLESRDLWNATVMKLRQIESSYNKKLDNLFASNVSKIIQSDVNGYYEFIDIPYGKYCILTEFTVFETHAQWLEPIEVKQKDTKIDLTNNNTRGTVYIHSSEGMEIYK